jgi:hypothetical protein
MAARTSGEPGPVCRACSLPDSTFCPTSAGQRDGKDKGRQKGIVYCLHSNFSIKLNREHFRYAIDTQMKQR